MSAAATFAITVLLVTRQGAGFRVEKIRWEPTITYPTVAACARFFPAWEKIFRMHREACAATPDGEGGDTCSRAWLEQSLKCEAAP